MHQAQRAALEFLATDLQDLECFCLGNINPGQPGLILPKQKQIQWLPRLRIWKEATSIGTKDYAKPQFGVTLRKSITYHAKANSHRISKSRTECLFIPYSTISGQYLVYLSRRLFDASYAVKPLEYWEPVVETV